MSLNVKKTAGSSRKSKNEVRSPSSSWCYRKKTETWRSPCSRRVGGSGKSYLTQNSTRNSNLQSVWRNSKRKRSKSRIECGATKCWVAPFSKNGAPTGVSRSSMESSLHQGSLCSLGASLEATIRSQQLTRVVTGGRNGSGYIFSTVEDRRKRIGTVEKSVKNYAR